MHGDAQASGAGGSLPGWTPAPPGRVALLWAAVSAAHQEIERRNRYFEAGPADDLLGEQLTLLAALHDWIPVTEEEVDALRAPLRAYVTRTASASSSAAREVSGIVLVMARDRGRIAPRYADQAGVDGPGVQP